MPKSHRPVSPQRLAANRANAARSTGPRTPQGKAHSSQNARKHVFTGSTFAVIRLEDIQEVGRLRDDLIALYQPVNSQELFALERAALAQHAILRGARLESGLFTTSLDESYDNGGEPIRLLNPVILGSGERLLDGFEAGKPALELVRVLEAPGVGHVRYRVIR